MAWTLSDLDTINAAIATGATSVTYADRRQVVYRSLAEMQAIKDQIEAALGVAPSVRRVAGGYNSGLSRGSLGFGFGPDGTCR